MTQRVHECTWIIGGANHAGRKKIEFKNPEGYADPTPYQALRNIELQERDSADEYAYRVIKNVLVSLDLYGFKLVGRLHIQDKITGREYK